MYEIVKNSVIGWWIGVVVALMLWYRGKKYGRMLGLVILIYALISLFNYGIYNGSNDKESGAAISAAIAIAAFLPLLAFLTLKSYSVIISFFLLILIVIILLVVFYGLGYSARYDIEKGKIIYSNYEGPDSFMGLLFILGLAFITIIGFLLLIYYLDNTSEDMLRLLLFFIAVLILLYMGYNYEYLSKIYYIIVILIFLALLV